jgi:hypothetical protein
MNILGISKTAGFTGEFGDEARVYRLALGYGILTFCDTR